MNECTVFCYLEIFYEAVLNSFKGEISVQILLVICHLYDYRHVERLLQITSKLERKKVAKMQP